MMSDEVSREVDQLLKDREKYESWLQRLESEKGAATNQAYERVRADYQKRLGEVVARLRAHGQGLENRLTEMESRLAELDRERQSRQEKLDEARLRRTVGEYTDEDEWSALEGQLQSDLQKVEGDLEGTRTEIEHLKQIVAQVGSEKIESSAPARTESPPPPARPAPSAAAEDEAADQARRPPPEERPAPAPAAEPPPHPEPERAPPPQSASEPEPEILAEELDTESDEGFLSLEELVLEDKDPEEAMRAPRSPEPEGETPSASAREEGGEGEVGDELAFLESLSLGAGEESESFSFLEQHGSGTPQTIICPHCSAANDPAEWYCTECGEELPAE